MNSNFHYRVHKARSLIIPIMSWINPLRNFVSFTLI
jgi:hypothetical protein